MSDAFASQDTSATRDFAVSDNACKRLIELLESEADGAMLRVSVSGGGCSGFQYGFTWKSVV